MPTFFQDVKFAVRMLARSPGFAAVAILTLALGIGANTTIFSFIHAVLIRPIPYADPAALVSVSARKVQQNNERDTLSYPNFSDLRDQNSSFENLAAYRSTVLALTGRQRPESITSAVVSASLFPVLRVSPLHGRTLLPTDDRPGADPAVVISARIWLRLFNADPAIIGSALSLNGKGFTVVGILPADFQFPLNEDSAEIWLPAHLDPDFSELIPHRGAGYLEVVGRLKPGVSLAQAQADLNVLTTRLAQSHPRNLVGQEIVVQNLQADIVGDVRAALFIFLAAIGFVLLIACANVANLMLARGAAREREIAIRVALGGSRIQIVRLLLGESVLVAVLGGALGLLLAAWGSDIALALLPDGLPPHVQIHLNTPTLFFSLALSLLTGVLFGLLPALQVSRVDLNLALKDGGRSVYSGLRHNRLRNLLVISEVALAVVLLAGAGLLIRSFLNLAAVNPGFDPQNVVTLDLNLPQYRYPKPHQQAAFFENVLTRVKSLPGVDSAAVILPLPFTGSNVILRFRIENTPDPPPGERSIANVRSVSPDYFKTMKIQLARGRVFTEADSASGPLVAIINESMARQHFPGVDPIGRRLTVDYVNSTGWRTIVGVVRDVHHTGLNQSPGLEVYTPYQQMPWWVMSLAVRTSVPPATLARAIETEIRAVDSELPTPEWQPMSTLVRDWMANARVSMLLVGTFAAVALVLAAVGIYSVLAYIVTQRTHEMGVRMALGAQARDIYGLVLRQGLRWMAVGLAIGVLASVALTQLLSSFLFGVKSHDPLTFVSVAVVLTVIGLVACWLPARRATRTDPLVALRYE